MKKYVLTSPRFIGAVTFGFNEDNKLVFYFNESLMTAEQVTWLLGKMPHNDDQLNQLKTIIQGTIEEIPADLSFDCFWDTYGQKINKKRCLPMYNKLSEANKLKAISNIKAYDAFCDRTGRYKADPENYLNKEYYLTDWKKQR
jgi:hypothetical protein